VLLVLFDPFLPVALEVFEDRVAGGGTDLDTDEFRSEALDVEAGQGARLGPLDVHREEVDLGDAEVVQQIVECNGGDADLLRTQLVVPSFERKTRSFSVDDSPGTAVR
jgi:hypothetical protein